MLGNQVGLQGASRDLNVLCRELESIFGDSVIGLWIGDDIIINGSGVITSWPARVGNNFTIYGSNVKSSTINSRKSMYIDISSRNWVYADTAIAPKSLWTITKFNSSSSGNQGCIQLTSSPTLGSQGSMIVNASNNYWYVNDNWKHFENGIYNQKIDINTYNIYEAVLSTNTYTGVRVGSWADGISWQEPIGIVLALSSVPTDAQRRRGVEIIRDYYGLYDNFTSSDLLTKELYDLFGSKLTSLYIGDDITTTDGYVTNWPGRVDSVLTNSTSEKFNYTTINGKSYITTNNGNTKSLNSTSVTNSLSCWAVAKSPAVVSNYKTLLRIDNGLGEIFTTNSSAFQWYGTGYDHYKNGIVNTNIVSTTEPTIYESSTNTCSTFKVGGNNSLSDRVWEAPIGFIMGLSSTASDSERASALSIIQRYYANLDGYYTSLIEGIGGIRTWLRPDSNITVSENKISVWGDRLNSGCNASQSTDSKRPIYRSFGGVNNLPYLECGAGLVQNILTFTDGYFSSLTAAEMFIIYQNNEATTDTNGYGGLHRMGASSLPNHFPSLASSYVWYDGFGQSARSSSTGITPTTNIQVYNSSITNGSFISRRNNIDIINTSSATISFSTTNQMILGDPNYSVVFLYGKMYEVLFFSKILTPLERLQVLAYINNRYSIMLV